MELAPRAVKVAPLQDYRLSVTFENGEVKLFDVKPYLDHPAFRELRIIPLFNAVKIGGLSIEWLRGQDICPDQLYFNSVSIPLEN
ncbi:MAG: DUF2442 domain-containing protein [Defluviitaleaceae bacterium]|nr:DUF2442 domain-containing protein [Defluviitaleaceae bacterium]